MKIKIRPEHASMLQMNDWPTGLRDGESARPAGPGNAEPCGPGPRGPGYAEPTSHGYAVPAGHGCTEPAAGSARPGALAGPAASAAPARTARIPAVPGAGTARGAAWPSSRDPGRAGRGYPPLSRAELEWHHDDPADEAPARWQIRGKPSRHLHSLAVALNPARAWRAHGGRQAAPRRDREHSEDLMVQDRARACSAGAMTSTGR